MKKTSASVLLLALTALLLTAPGSRADEQCCPACPDGVMVGVTATACGTCVDLKNFIPGCTAASNGKCTACAAGYYLSGGTCIPCSTTLPGCTACSNATTCTACAGGYTLSAGQCNPPSGTVQGITCKVKTFTTYQNDTPYYIPVFFPGCQACHIYTGYGCGTCLPGKTLKNNQGTGYYCE